jgi:hypothetical protein
MKHKIPSTNNQIMTKISKNSESFRGLEFGDWILFGIWDLVIGI